jgi:hypothetical protein
MPRRTTIVALLLTMLATCLSVVVGAAPAQAVWRYAIKNHKSQLYLQPDDSFSAGTVVVQRPWQPGGWQEWTYVVDGAYVTFEIYLGRKNLGISRGSTQPYVLAVLGNPSGAYNQDWQVITHGSLVELKNRGSGLCLGIDRASTASGASAIQAPCDGLANQRWEIIPW